MSALGSDTAKYSLPLAIRGGGSAQLEGLPLLFTGHLLRRWEGALFLAYAVAYTAFVVLEATAHPMREPFAQAMIWFVMPLTLVTLVSVVVIEVRARRGRRLA